MALVPILCPQCNASVDIEEGQTIVRCGYCNTSSYLKMPAAPAPPMQAPPMRPPQQQLTPAQLASMRKSANRTMMIILTIVGVVMVVSLGGALWFGGSTLNHFEDAEGAGELLTDEFGKDARYLKLYLHERYIYVDILEEDGKIEGRRIRGRDVGKAEPQSASSYEFPDKDAFTLKDIDLKKVSKISKHARGRVDGAKLTALSMWRSHPRQQKLLWQALLDVGGRTQIYYYGLDGKPLAEKKIDFLTATPKDLGKQLRDAIGHEPKVTSIRIAKDTVNVTAMAKDSARNTDSFRYSNDGVLSGPEPNSNDGNAEELAKSVFSLNEVSWSLVPKAFAAVGKRFGEGTSEAVSVSKKNGVLQYRASMTNKRSAYRYIDFDADMKELGASDP